MKNLLWAIKFSGILLLWFLNQIITALFILVIGLISYYYFEIRPQIQETLVVAQPYLSDKPVMKSLREIAIKITGNNPYGVIAHSIRPSAPIKGHLYWHSSNAAWVFWLTNLYSDDEIYAMSLSKTYFGQDAQGNAVYGAREAAEKLFHTKLEETSCEQRVQMMFMLKAPSLYKPGSERLVKGSQRLCTFVSYNRYPKNSHYSYVKE